MNLVVTGATSFLGAALVEELLKTGHRVYAVVRPRSKNREVLEEAGERSGRGTDLHILETELGDLDQIGEKIKDSCQVFFHLAWGGSGSEARKDAGLQKKNVEDSLKALAGARSLGCSRFVFTGSQAEYGRYQTPMKEELPCRPISEYGKAKAEFGCRARETCRRWRDGKEYRMEYVHARIFSIYGPGDHPWSLVNTCLDTFLADKPMKLGTCTQQWNFLYIDDLVKGLTTLGFCEEPMEGDEVYNLAGDEKSTRPLKAYVEEIHELCGGRGSCVYGVYPPNAEGSTNLIPDITRVTQKTGWTPQISFEEGIRRMLARKGGKN